MALLNKLRILNKEWAMFGPACEALAKRPEKFGFVNV